MLILAKEVYVSVVNYNCLQSYKTNKNYYSESKIAQFRAQKAGSVLTTDVAFVQKASFRTSELSRNVCTVHQEIQQLVLELLLRRIVWAPAQCPKFISENHFLPQDTK